MGENNGTAMVPTEPAGTALMLSPVVSPTELIKHADEVAEFVAGALIEGKDRDFAVIPGTNKPTLLQPGAEKLLTAFRLMPTYDVVESEVDHNREVIWTKPKPKTKPAGWDMKCSACGGGIREGEPQVSEKDADGNWTNTCAECAQEAMGGQEGHSLGLYRYVVRCKLVNRATGEVVGEGMASCSTMESKYIDRPRDCENTVVQMAQKRAMVRAVRNTLGLSNRFTQDVEDQAGGGYGGDGGQRDRSDNDRGSRQSSRSSGNSNRRRQSGGDSDGPVRMKAKLASKCDRCGEPIAIGDPIVWDKGKGAWHAECDFSDDAPRQDPPQRTAFDEDDDDPFADEEG